jgi:hypothetical protein
MDAKDIKITKTPFEPINTLPEVFPEANNIGLAISYKLGKPMDMTDISLIITPTCVVFKNEKENVLHELSCKSVYTIHSKHEMFHNYQIFHECLSREAKAFKDFFYSLDLKGYHNPVFPIPTLDNILPTLQELFNPASGASLS